MEHRWGERLQVDIPVRVAVHPYAVRDGKLSNLSVSGAMIRVESDARLFSQIEIAIEIPSFPKHEAPTVGGYVTRKYKEGIGIEWCEFSPRAISDLLRAMAIRPYTHLRRFATSTSSSISRLSAPLLKHGT
ncbi:MAG: PilZ domain-containing protein [Pseudomonadota bacterium]|nr:PilZ domain-containing protein [Pseudomonadota bacterium]